MAIRPIHYLGNKSRFLDSISSAVFEVTPEGSTALDLFAGTGVVTRALAQASDVVSVDIQTYSSILADALCAPRNYGPQSRRKITDNALAWLDEIASEVAPLLAFEDDVIENAVVDPDAFALLTEDASLASTHANDPRLAELKAAALPLLTSAGATITSYYGGVYFSYRQALEIDAVLHSLGHTADARAEATAVASLMGAASDLVSTVGNHFAQPMRLRDRSGTPKTAVIARTAKARKSSILEAHDIWLQKYAGLEPSKFMCTTRTTDFREALSFVGDRAGAIYADPPYTRDHYSRFYHVLETIALGDDPGVSMTPGTTNPSRGLYRVNRHQSPFSIQSQAPAAFSELFSAAGEHGTPIVLSYSPQGTGTKARPETRVMTIEQLVELAGQHFNKVDVRFLANSSHSKFNRAEVNGVASPQAEALIIAKN